MPPYEAAIVSLLVLITGLFLNEVYRKVVKK